MASSQPLYSVTPTSDANRSQQAFRRSHAQHASMGSYNAAGIGINLPPQGGPGRRPSAVSTGDAPLEQVRKVTSKVEDYIEQATQPLKPFLPGAGRFLIVVTFLEDSLRILTQWTDQLYYLQRHRGFPWGISHIFLFVNIVTMLGASSLVIGKKFPDYAVAGLFAVVMLQGFGYGLIFDINFFLRNLSVCGGLLMVLSDSLMKRKEIFAGLPQLSESDRRHYFQLAGRVLLIFLFIGFVFNGKFTLIRAFVSLFGLGACIMVAVGFRARESAIFLVLLLSVFNVLINNWWAVHSTHPQRDFLKYDFYQTLSVVGGLILLANMGAGTISMDAKKKL